MSSPSPLQLIESGTFSVEWLIVLSVLSVIGKIINVMIGKVKNTKLRKIYILALIKRTYQISRKLHFRQTHKSLQFFKNTYPFNTFTHLKQTRYH